MSTFDSLNPITGEVIATFPIHSEMEVHTQVDASLLASPLWQTLGYNGREEVLRAWSKEISRRSDELARLVASETGKPLSDASLEVALAIEQLSWAAKNAKKILSDSKRPSGLLMFNMKSKVQRVPFGTVGVIGPWNYPLLQVSWKVAPALVAGCTFIVKPAELTPSTAIHLFKLIDEAGAPAGVANLILGKGSSIGDLLTADPRIDLVSFTGSLGIGQRIMSLASKTIKKVALELGGKNPNIIFADSDVDAAIDNAVTAGFLHSGQVCSAGTRLVVEKSIHDRVVNEIVRRAKDIKVGGPTSEDAETGPLISSTHLNKVQEYVDKGVAEGAKLLVGGKKLTEGDFAKGNFFPPTVLDGCNTNMTCVQDESFGPVITVETFETEAEAIEIANDTIYGLSGAVWTKDEAKARRVSRALRHGTVWVNDYGPYKPQAEWGGFKASGIGRELGEHGLSEFLESKHIWTNNKPGKSGWFADK